MKKIKVSIERRETITLEVDISDEVSQAEIFERIHNDPGNYLEKHLSNIIKDNVIFDIASLTIVGIKS